MQKFIVLFDVLSFNFVGDGFMMLIKGVNFIDFNQFYSTLVFSMTLAQVP